jgi:hypothetical protein
MLLGMFLPGWPAVAHHWWVLETLCSRRHAWRRSEVSGFWASRGVVATGLPYGLLKLQAGRTKVGIGWPSPRMVRPVYERGWLLEVSCWHRCRRCVGGHGTDGTVGPAQVPYTQVPRTTSVVRLHAPLGDLGMVSKREGFSANARIFVASLIILGDGHSSGTSIPVPTPQTWSGDESGRSANPQGCTGLVGSGMKSSRPSTGTNKTPDLRNEPLVLSNRGCFFPSEKV